MATVLFMVIANAISVQCIGTNCFQIPNSMMTDLGIAGAIELILEIRGFIRIYKRKD